MPAAQAAFADAWHLEPRRVGDPGELQAPLGIRVLAALGHSPLTRGPIRAVRTIGLRRRARGR